MQQMLKKNGQKGGLRFDMEISPYQNEAITFLNSIGIAGEN